ncbi:MAG: BatA domain-containing protein, partial [Alistipes sp.]|nr:BatA domain-containing protein [Alistipes sp.]
MWLLLVLLPMIGYYIYRARQGKATLQISSVAGLHRLPRGVKYYLRYLPFVLRCLAVAALIFALARPQSTSSNNNSTTEG